MSLRSYIEDRSIPEPTSGCWIWLKSLGTPGYGNACYNKKIIAAHRFSYEAFVGEIPEGMLVQHSCDNRWCVAPHHLKLGTDATNALDKQRKGRAAKKLTTAQVLDIRSRVQSTKSLAREFKVHPKMITMIKRRQKWTHI